MNQPIHCTTDCRECPVGTASSEIIMVSGVEIPEYTDEEFAIMEEIWIAEDEARHV